MHSRDKKQDSYDQSTTHLEIVAAATNYPELVTRLYDFVLERTANLPRNTRHDQLRSAAGELIARLMEETRDAQQDHPGHTDLDCAKHVLRSLSKPDSRALLHKKPGVRRRLKKMILREAGRRPTLLDNPDALPHREADCEPLPAVDRGAEAIPEPLLEEIQEQLREVWLRVLERALDRVRSHSRVFRRRKTIIEIFAECALKRTPAGIVSKVLEEVLRTTRPRMVIGELRQRGIVTTRGRHAATDKQLREDILLVKRALLAELDSMKLVEHELQQRVAAQRARKRFAG